VRPIDPELLDKVQIIRVRAGDDPGFDVGYIRIRNVPSFDSQHHD